MTKRKKPSALVLDFQCKLAAGQLANLRDTLHKLAESTEDQDLSDALLTCAVCASDIHESLTIPPDAIPIL